MSTAVYIPFVVSMAIALTVFWLHRLRPRAAAWALSVTAGSLALSVAAALGLLASPLLGQIPFVAALGQWTPDSVALHTPVPDWLSATALIVLVASGASVAWELNELVRQHRRAVRAGLGKTAGSDLVVLDDEVARAHALSTPFGRRSRIVITTRMLALLDDDERAAVLAHERAHVAHRHATFVATIRLSTALNPLLRPLRPRLAFALERWADEDAAARTARPVLAGALAKVALDVASSQRMTAGVIGLSGTGVTERVSALLEQPNQRSAAAWVLVAGGIVAAVAVVVATRDTERFFDAVRVWSNY